MKEKDLRIGNWIYRNDNIPIKTHIEHIRRINNGSLVFKPIPLTEEILLKCGFEPFQDVYILNDIQIEPINKGYILVSGYGEFRIGIEFYYLHQLQNIIFALTGKELEINL